MNISHYHFPTLDSTNSWAKREAANFNRKQLTIVTAERQSAGRGQKGRPWQSSDNNLLCSFCLFVDEVSSHPSNYSILMALAAAIALENLGYLPELKWPNDILIAGKKVGGILTETTPLENQRCIIIGVGLNIDMSQNDLASINQPATALSLENGQRVNVGLVLEALKQSFLNILDTFSSTGLKPLLPEYSKRLIHRINEPFCYSDTTGLRQGIYEGINEDGSLQIRSSEGTQHSLISGEIIANPP